MKQAKDRIIFAADMEVATLGPFLSQLSGAIGVIKLGQEIITNGFLTGQSAFTDVLTHTDLQVMYDIKADDIPGTIGATAKQVALYGKGRIFGMTVHCSAGGPALKMAVQAIEDNFSDEVQKPYIIGVTLLTSMKPQDISDLGINGDAGEIVKRWAVLARDSGVPAIVCSAKETSIVRDVYPQAVIINPAIRFAGSDVGTQNAKRVTTPGQAIAGGADYVVMGSDLKMNPVANAARAAGEIHDAVLAIQSQRA